MAFPNYRWLDFPAILGLAGLYCLLAKIVLTYFSETGNVTLVWFSSGLGLAALLLKGLRYWPGIFLGAFAAGLMVDDSFTLSFAIASGNTLESVTAAYLLKRHRRFSLALTEPGHFIWLTLIGAACSLISAGIGPWALHQAGSIPLAAMPQSILHWWMADAFGIVTTTPIILVWRNWPNQWFAEKRGLEALLLIIRISRCVPGCLWKNRPRLLDVSLCHLGRPPFQSSWRDTDCRLDYHPSAVRSRTSSRIFRRRL
jgi:integral membrane sensor domain MASE1